MLVLGDVTEGLGRLVGQSLSFGFFILIFSIYSLGYMDGL